MPKISVIVPVYNVGKYLPSCIDSILNQTFTDFELLLIDDESKDNSGKICDEYAKKDSRIRVFHKENGGVSSARNVGLDNAKCEWIVFVDADDEIEHDCFSIIKSHLNTGKTCFYGCKRSSGKEEWLIKFAKEQTFPSVADYLQKYSLNNAVWGIVYEANYIFVNAILNFLLI